MSNTIETFAPEGEELVTINITDISVSSFWGLKLFTAAKGQYSTTHGIVRVVVDPPTLPAHHPNLIHNLQYHITFELNGHKVSVLLKYLMSFQGYLIFGN